MKTIRILSVAAIAAAVTITPSLFAGESCSSKNASASASTANNDIVAVASSAGSFNTLIAAVKAAGLAQTLQGRGPFTVFAPTDEAFAKLPKGTVEDLLKPENREKLAAILTYHVVAGKVMATDVKTMEVATVNGKELDVKVADGVVTVSNAKVVKTDVAASNGVIHVIDTVLLPN
jgi:transforming growth factor-beta-induced protein